MPIANRILKKLGDPADPSSFTAKARGARWRLLLERFPRLPEMHVLDLGGTPLYWELAPVRPARVTTLNFSSHTTGERWISQVVGDACNPPDTVLAGSYDLVHSNSVIEHVGGHARRVEFARVAADLALRHWIQTPYRYFPIEPHWMFPGFQFLPFPARVWLTRRWPLGHFRSSPCQRAVGITHSIELLAKSQFVSYFPESEILFERMMGLPKSMIAVRRSTD